MLSGLVNEIDTKHLFPAGSMKPKRPESVRSIVRGAGHVLRRAGPHLALMVIYTVYLMLGALAFCSLEHGTEAIEYDREMQRRKSEIKDILMNVSSDNMTAREGKQMMDDKLDRLTEMMTRPDMKDGRIQASMVNRTFSFASSVLFCMTTITTIGYGDIVPTTTGGRSFCIVYALFGIPLTLLCLADIGDLLARLVLCVCRKLGINKCSRRIQDECSRSTPDSDFTMDHTHVIRETTMSDINSSKNRGTDTDKSMHGVNLHENMMDKHGDGGRAVDMEGGATHNQSAASSHVSHHHKKGGVCTKEGGCQKEEVPILVILFILMTYVCGGSFVLVLSEEWSFGIGIYFTIITLTTIGFGDFVPTNIYARHGFVFQIGFTLLGMAIMSMTIALLKNKVVRAVTYIFSKLNA